MVVRGYRVRFRGVKSLMRPSPVVMYTVVDLSLLDQTSKFMDAQSAPRQLVLGEVSCECNHIRWEALIGHASIDVAGRKSSNRLHTLL